MFYNSYFASSEFSLLTWGNKCSKIELLQKKAVRLVNFKTPIAHTEPLFKQMNQVKLSDLYNNNNNNIYLKSNIQKSSIDYK